jgi:hypothetical protein
MTHLCCIECRLRFAPSAVTHATCARCGAPLTALAAPDAMGYSLSPRVDAEWGAADLDALARAVANVIASTPL